jgi:hypothetical protein
MASEVVIKGFGVLVLTILFVSALSGADLGLKPTKPTWSIDLTEVPNYTPGLSAENPMPGAQVQFVSKDTIAVSFLSSNSSSKGAFVFTALFIHTEKGNIQNKLQLPAKSRTSQLLPTNNGEFLVSTGVQLLRYSSTKELLQSRSISDPVKTGFMTSPDGMLLLIRDFVDGGIFKQSVVPTADLSKERPLDWNGIDTRDISSRGETLELRLNPKKRPDDYRVSHRVCICRSKAKCISIYPNATMEAEFLDDDTVFVTTGSDSWALVTRDKRLLFRSGKVGGPIGKNSVASRAKRFSFATGFIAEDWVYNVRVFDTDRLEYVQQFDFRKPTSLGVDSGYGDFDQALSPDGTSIVILRGKVLELYRLPN